MKVKKFEQLVFDFVYCNMFGISALYLVFPELSRFFSSNIWVAIPILFSIVLSFMNIRKLRKITLGEVIIILICMSYMLFALLGDSFLKPITFSSSFLVMVSFGLFIFTREDLNYTIAHLKTDALIVAVLFSLLALKSGTDIFSSSNIYMTIGYGLSLQTIILYEKINVVKKSSYIPPLVFTAIIAIYGNRGALLVVIAYLFVTFIIRSKERKIVERIAIILACVIIGLIIYFFFVDILNMVSNILSSFGLSSRSLQRLTNQTFINDSDREYIRQKILDILVESPFSIRGLGYLVKISGNETMFIGNAHNIILELMVEYGIAFGSILSIIVFGLVVKACKLNMVCKCNASVLAYCALFDAIVMLMLSNTIYSCNEFWIGLIMFTALSKQNRQKIS